MTSPDRSASIVLRALTVARELIEGQKKRIAMVSLVAQGHLI